MIRDPIPNLASQAIPSITYLIRTSYGFNLMASRIRIKTCTSVLLIKNLLKSTRLDFEKKLQSRMLFFSSISLNPDYVFDGDYENY